MVNVSFKTHLMCIHELLTIRHDYRIQYHTRIRVTSGLLASSTQSTLRYSKIMRRFENWAWPVSVLRHAGGKITHGSLHMHSAEGCRSAT
jgi:hypothetical protein